VHELKSGEQPVVPGALAVEVMEEVREGKKTRVVVAACPPMSADLIRWLYARHNPALNINFGPGPAEELRSKFILKLWNTYAFFCNYARLDSFDPNAPPVPVARRPDIDRWILSDLQLLIQKSHEAFKNFNVMAFCLEAEQFVDGRLSNWYVRRNRRRFWKSETGDDKLGAYQTLYTVLMTLTKLFAPILPFLTESMYQNLKSDRGAGTVHLCDYPQVDEALIDKELSADMEALLRLVSLGSKARNSVKIKVRQPLGMMKIAGGRGAQRAVKRFADQLCEELNLKRVILHDSSKEPLLRTVAKPNLKKLGPQYGDRLPEVVKAIEEYTGQGKGVPNQLECPGGTVFIESDDLFVEFKASEEGWVGAADGDTEVLLDARLTEELKLEGMAREVVRHVQNARKEAELEMEDRIILYVHTDSPKLRAAIEAHRSYIAAETLTTQWATAPLGQGAYRAEVKVDGQPLTIELRKVSPVG
jgi:isoleucyl-tRNA synthetase